jgi:hypothetical protein
MIYLVLSSKVSIIVACELDTLTAAQNRGTSPLRMNLALLYGLIYYLSYT